ncbi:MAG: class I poly(R)-hydroxyalkanoic acid synthase, partial [Rhodospirillales bacterium]|nr:class I poly(R)-hydroxyalkanoic acid synthase [Rhodospirillales bacterium]
MNAPLPPKEPDIKLPDAGALSRSMADIAARSQKLVAEWMKRQAAEGLELDPLNISGAFMEMTTKLLANPAQMVEAQMGLWRDYMTLWQNTARRIISGEEPAPVIANDPKDKRFADPAWRQNEIFDF